MTTEQQRDQWRDTQRDSPTRAGVVGLTPNSRNDDIWTVQRYWPLVPLPLTSKLRISLLKRGGGVRELRRHRRVAEGRGATAFAAIGRAAQRGPFRFLATVRMFARSWLLAKVHFGICQFISEILPHPATVLSISCEHKLYSCVERTNVVTSLHVTGEWEYS